MTVFAYRVGETDQLHEHVTKYIPWTINGSYLKRIPMAK